MKNLLIRTGSGIVFLIIMVACLLSGPVSYACLMLFLLIGMMHEFYRMALGPMHRCQKLTGILSGVALWLAVFLYFECRQWIGMELIAGLFSAVFVLWLVLLIQQLYRKAESPFAMIAGTLLGFIYIALPLSLLNFLVYNFGTAAYDGSLLLGLFIILWGSDVGAYVFGMLFGQKGKHKLFPSISPKKSWEGFIGGVLVAVGIAWLLDTLSFFHGNPPHPLLLGSLISVFGMFGDLLESMFKRSAGVKDSGKIMPGHGGLLDRFDAALLAFPVVWLLMLIANKNIFIQ
jgi:phosphatidate cytidylyltransferase